MAAKGRMELTRGRELFKGGMARLTLGVAPTGRQFVIRELLRRNLFRLRLHRGFVRGTNIRVDLTPHPNIVSSAENGYSGLLPYEVIEFVDGESVRRCMQHRNSAIAERSFEILKQAATALAHVHEMGYIHLDVKAENFLLSQNDGKITVKLTDFDLSLPSGIRHSHTRSGTEAYMAPEQLRADSVTSPAADIFAFGVMAYNLVTGHMPFEGKSVKERRYRQMSDSYTPVPPRERKPDLMPHLDWLIMRCLEKDAAKRFPSMSYLCKELAKL
ncbi:MAG: serine/threonine protein kinase [Lentisphaerae bacterium]|mgnify:CR=1 FL=1|nr:serine/threonine protein kinase [Lentisphaerota bacterium]MBT4814407.1 serine/threonine protein kinase [Lentisphaerota bacterium]MBT5606302.1 serine/threonine protein kinase [Lentisphaerota bacterium]MBT7059358.1 serine/threonine protein kinase [Lentisphaerota bacterium]MBT7848253.1 serine/threonine protein kinase [Lentisphaerota bacterium]